MKNSKYECEKSTEPIADPDDAECDAIPTWFVVAVMGLGMAWTVAIGVFIARGLIRL